jgi:hypothetical protein
VYLRGNRRSIASYTADCPMRRPSERVNLKGTEQVA